MPESRKKEVPLKIYTGNHRPLRELVYEQLREAILTGEIKPGTRLMEVEIAQKMGVSRTPIREAIKKLEIEGLATTQPRRGAYVSEISVKSMVDILEVRSNLEGLAAYLAAYRMDKPTQRELMKVEEVFEEAVRNGNMETMIKADDEFHRMVIQSSGNSHLIHMLDQIQELVVRFRYLCYKDYHRLEELIPEHLTIFEAIVESRAEKARNAAYSHIDKMKDMILRDDLK